MDTLWKICILAVATVAACSYDASQLVGPPVDGAGLKDTGGDQATSSSGNPDAADDAPQATPDACIPETDQEMCARLGKDCDPFSGLDNCGQARSIASCGVCGPFLVCGASLPNVCPVVCAFDRSNFDQCAFSP
jgi:hypothetical protein